MALHLAIGLTYQKGTFDFSGSKRLKVIFPTPFKAGTTPDVTLTPEDSAISLHKKFVTNTKFEIHLNQNSSAKGTWSAAGEI